VSIGVTLGSPEELIKPMLAQADSVFYQAKEVGWPQCVFAKRY